MFEARRLGKTLREVLLIGSHLSIRASDFRKTTRLAREAAQRRGVSSTTATARLGKRVQHSLLPESEAGALALEDATGDGQEMEEIIDLDALLAQYLLSDSEV